MDAREITEIAKSTEIIDNHRNHKQKYSNHKKHGTYIMYSHKNHQKINIELTKQNMEISESRKSWNSFKSQSFQKSHTAYKITDSTYNYNTHTEIMAITDGTRRNLKNH